MRDAALKKAKAAEEAREAVEAERDSLKAQILSLERDVAAAKQVRGGHPTRTVPWACVLRPAVKLVNHTGQTPPAITTHTHTTPQEGESERRKLEDLKHERDVLIKMRSNVSQA